MKVVALSTHDGGLNLGALRSETGCGRIGVDVVDISGSGPVDLEFGTQDISRLSRTHANSCFGHRLLRLLVKAYHRRNPSYLAQLLVLEKNADDAVFSIGPVE